MVRLLIYRIILDKLAFIACQRSKRFVDLGLAWVDDDIGHSGIEQLNLAIGMLRQKRSGLIRWACGKRRVILLHPGLRVPVFNSGVFILCQRHSAGQPALVWCQYLVRMLSYQRMLARLPLFSGSLQIARCITAALKAELRFVRSLGGAPFAEEKLARIVSERERDGNLSLRIGS